MRKNWKAVGLSTIGALGGIPVLDQTFMTFHEWG